MALVSQGRLADWAACSRLAGSLNRNTELVHVLQYRRFVLEPAFACAYGVGYAEAGFDYASNPLEREAYDFVSANSSVI